MVCHRSEAVPDASHDRDDRATKSPRRKHEPLIGLDLNEMISWADAPDFKRAVLVCFGGGIVVTIASQIGRVSSDSQSSQISVIIGDDSSLHHGRPLQDQVEILESLAGVRGKRSSDRIGPFSPLAVLAVMRDQVVGTPAGRAFEFCEPAGPAISVAAKSIDSPLLTLSDAGATSVAATIVSDALGDEAMIA